MRCCSQKSLPLLLGLWRCQARLLQHHEQQFSVWVFSCMLAGFSDITAPWPKSARHHVALVESCSGQAMSLQVSSVYTGAHALPTSLPDALLEHAVFYHAGVAESCLQGAIGRQTGAAYWAVTALQAAVCPLPGSLGSCRAEQVYDKPLMPHCLASLMITFSMQTCNTGQVMGSTPNKQMSCLGKDTVTKSVKLQS